MPNAPITAPGGYYVPNAVVYADEDGNGRIVNADFPLPVALPAPAASTPLAGSASSTSVLGPFTPAIGQPIWLSLSGTWAGTVTVKRSTDGGATKVPLTAGGLSWASFTGNACEPVAEEGASGATYYLDVTLASGTLAYRLAQ